MESLNAKTLFEECKNELRLELVGSGLGSRLPITVSDVNRPGLALAGFTENFLSERVQILGETELLYLSRLDEKEQREAIDRLFLEPLPVIIVAKNLEVPSHLVQRANENQVPLLRTSFSTTPFIHQITAYLEECFSPETTVHATLADVYGVGLLITGRSGIGKSETALDLVERGHRLVADDVVTVVRRPQGFLVGWGNPILGHRMEIRGIGIIDVREMFGVRAIRQEKRIEVEVRLEEWDDATPYERLGLEPKMTTFLGTRIEMVRIPIVPGKNVTVIAEVIAMNYLLRRYGGKSPAEELAQELSAELRRKERLGMAAPRDWE